MAANEGKNVFKEMKDNVAVNKDALELMQKGSLMTKVRSAGRRYTRNFFVDKDGLTLRYSGSRKNALWYACHRNPEDQSRISIGEIAEIKDETGKKGTIPMFTLVVGENMKTLNLIAPTSSIKDAWLKGLKYLMNKHSSASPAEAEAMWLTEQFRDADRNENGVLDREEAAELMMSLNVCPIKATLVKKQIKVDHVSVKEFINIYRELSRRSEIDDLFKKYSQSGDAMTADELGKFFEKEMNEKLPDDKLKEIIKSNESCPQLQEKGVLSLVGFSAVFATPLMNIRRPECAKVYQDMTRPLNDYFVNSSHNTYLEGHQLTGMSSVEQYARVLMHKCRCVELDVWDGDDDEPIIYHGYTLTSKILFKDVVYTINENAFRRSPYPVILSIENHCSVDQQRRMAEYLHEILGSKLYLGPLPENAAHLPSPEDLKEKIIIKAKKLPADALDGGIDSVSEEDEAAEMDDDEVRQKVKMRRNAELDHNDIAKFRQIADIAKDDTQKAKRKSKKHKCKLAPELSDCVIICQAVSFKSFENSLKQSFLNMSSFGEANALKFSTEDGGQDFVRHNAWQLSRIYPAGSRTSSSNYNPIPMWMAGCQLVALNFQTRDTPLLVNYGFFQDNGACGYVLKPEFMRSGSANFNQNGPHPKEWTRKLTIKIISGYSLPKKIGDDLESILDPYVEVEIFGVPADESVNKTEVVKNNGFHPVWNETLEFTVTCPQLAVVMFRVMDYESTSADLLVAQYCLPMRCMQTGYRMVALRNVKGETIGPTSLFVHVSIDPPK